MSTRCYLGSVIVPGVFAFYNVLLIGGCTLDEGPPVVEPWEVWSVSADPLERPDDFPAEVVPFRHPLQPTSARSEPAPIVEAIDAPDGRRYAIMEGIEVSEDGVMSVSSGIVELEYRRLGRTDRRPAREASALEGQTIGEPLAAAIRGGGAEEVNVLVRVQRPGGSTLVERLDGSIAAGLIESEADYEAERLALLEVQDELVAREQEPVIRAIEAIGGTISYRCIHLACLNASIPAKEVANLARHPSVVRLDLDVPIEPSADVAGKLIIQGTQTKQFIDAGADGENGAASNLRLAVFEPGGFHDQHKGFRTGTGTANRIAGRYVCDSSKCASVTSFASKDKHATAVAGLVFGDLRDGQDPAIVDGTARIERSGYAGEALAYLYQTGQMVSGARVALDHVIGRSPRPHVVNLSSGSFGDDQACLGESALSRDANDLYQNGILLVNAAGNDGHDWASDCIVYSPGSAIGVFTVGSHGTHNNGSEYWVRNAAISWFSSMGGTAYEGKGRTIIDMTAYGYRKLMFDVTGGYTFDGGGTLENPTGGTSFAAPIVSSGAILFIDHYKKVNGGSTFIDKRGVLFANLLLMGDRQGQSGRRSSGFDSLWGAGRFRMRKPDSGGMDAPFAWKTGEVCVKDDEVVTIPINGGKPIHADANDFKAALYWFDVRHETGTTIDDLDLALVTTGGTNLVTSASAHDNKEFVYHSAIGGKAVKLEIRGFKVNATGTACGPGRMLAQWAYFYEDDARNDADGPSLASVAQE